MTLTPGLTKTREQESREASEEKDEHALARRGSGLQMDTDEKNCRMAACLEPRLSGHLAQTGHTHTHIHTNRSCGEEGASVMVGAGSGAEQTVSTSLSGKHVITPIISSNTFGSHL